MGLSWGLVGDGVCSSAGSRVRGRRQCNLFNKDTILVVNRRATRVGFGVKW